jgi:arylsulfatase A-like enzyme
VQNIDYAPTLLAAAGLKPDWDVHGISFLPILTNGGATPEGFRDTIYYRYIDGGHGVAKHSAIRTDRYKLLYFDRPRNEAEQKHRWELFDLQNDPQEMHNLSLSSEHEQLLASMKERFARTRKFYGDTDESVWRAGRGKRYADDAYLRAPRKRRK